MFQCTCMKKGYLCKSILSYVADHFHAHCNNKTKLAYRRYQLAVIAIFAYKKGKNKFIHFIEK